ncbi:retinoblastoma-like protein 1 [Elysia marginata]|uniref:Retinoblastoma-like protein 1 n=1 Tax=Elysia marginata TaxID=1093978 RepID=A0AAV4JIL5_9GAST|nr:retinoblastoma-like protein 1 [Elysia marginata]
MVLPWLHRKMINNLYEEYVLGVGDFDERIFLGDDAQEEIGTPGGQQNATDLTDQMVKRSIKQHFDELTEYPGASTDFARKRLHLGESLYYKTLEAIADGEKQRLLAADNKDWKTHLQVLLENDSFHRSLFACCLEIVIFSYNSQRTFPWIVDIFEFSSYQFYKVIEIIIRAEKGLSRDVVKHLNHIEESILESYAWKSDSPLWDSIKESSVPTCEEVTPLSHMEGWRTGSAAQPVKKKWRSLVGTIKPVSQKPAELLSPGGGAAVVSAADRFSSPTPGNAKRRLFGVGPAAAVAVANSTTSSTFTTSGPSPSPGSSVAQVPVANALAGFVPPTPPPGVSIISAPSQLPAGTSLATSSSTAAPTGPAASRSILLNQLKGGTSYSVVVPNKVANCLAPSSMLPKSNSPPPIITTTTTAQVADAAAITSVPAVDQITDSSNNSLASSSTTVSDSSSQNTSGTGGNQQAIVAVMEDGRQILIPVQIETPASASASTATLGSNSISSTATINITTASVSSSSNTKPASPGSTTTIVSIKSPGQGYRQVQVKLNRNLDIDLTFKKPKKTGSLSLFFRKVTEKPQTFQNIMKCYRLQPQAHSHVYRSVLLTSRQRHGSGSSDGEARTASPEAVDSSLADGTKDDKKRHLTVRSSSTLPHPQPNSQPPTPTKFLGHAENVNQEDERGDLIQFYNAVYLKKIRNFAMKFTEKSTDLTDQPKLSPLPAGRSMTLSPRRVSSNHSLFISPVQGQAALSSLQNRGLSYSINKSPSKELQAINKMIRQGAALVQAHGGPQLQQHAHMGTIKSAKRVLEVDQEEDSVQSPAAKSRMLTVSTVSGGGLVQHPVLHPLIRRLQEMDQH